MCGQDQPARLLVPRKDSEKSPLALTYFSHQETMVSEFLPGELLIQLSYSIKYSLTRSKELM